MFFFIKKCNILIFFIILPHAYFKNCHNSFGYCIDLFHYINLKIWRFIIDMYIKYIEFSSILVNAFAEIKNRKLPLRVQISRHNFVSSGGTLIYATPVTQK